MKNIILLLLGCLAMLNAVELNLDLDNNGNVCLAGIPASLPCGFTVKERIFTKTEPEVVLKEDLQNGTRQWEAAVFGGKTPDPGCELIAENGETFIRVGGKGRYGHGVQPKQVTAVKPGCVCEISFKGRVPNPESTFIVYLKVYDAEGKDITDDIPAGGGWSYSPFSHTHCRYPISLTTSNQWETVKLIYPVPQRVHGVRFSICQWRGLHADCAGYQLSCKGGAVTREVVFDNKRQAFSAGDLYSMYESEADKLSLATIWRRGKHGEWTVHAVVMDKSQPPKPRALDVEFRLAMDCIGGKWHRLWRDSREIKADQTYSLPATSVGSHGVAPYPFTSIEKNGVKLALGTPFDKPAFEDRVVDGNGIVSRTAIGLMPRDGHAGGGELYLVVFSFDGDWGFRSAMKRYNEIYGELFASRTKPLEEGTWLWPIWPGALPEKPEDFGLAFWEAPATMGSKEEIEKGHAHGIRAFPYTEAWGMRQEIAKKPGTDEHISVAERLAELKGWAENPEEGKTWFDAPRHIAAQAALNSLPVKPDGEHPYAVDQYDKWFHWWRTNSDSRLPRPNRASLCWEYTIGKNIDLVDGVYLDSLDYTFAVNYLNVRPEHLAVMAETLIYDSVTGVPCADGIQHQVAFVRWLAGHLHARGKMIFGNVFGISHRFHGASVDIFGSEVGSWGGGSRDTVVQDDDSCCMKRFYAWHRPVCNLLQEGNYSRPVPEVTAEQMLRYCEHQLFYGFYPGVSTIGGEEKAGYANWKRYFGKTRQCERDRELFKTIVPLVRRLNAAGWEPETMARCGQKNIMVERYGDGRDGRELLFTVRNESNKDIAEVELVVEADANELACLYGDVELQKIGEKTWRMPLKARKTTVVMAK